MKTTFSPSDIILVDEICNKFGFVKCLISPDSIGMTISRSFKMSDLKKEIGDKFNICVNVEDRLVGFYI